MTGYLNDHTLDNFKDENGTTFREAAARIGYTSSSNQVSPLSRPSPG